MARGSLVSEEAQKRCLQVLFVGTAWRAAANRRERSRERLDKWLFTMNDHRWFCMAGIWREMPEGVEAFTLLTMDAGEDISPYHHRQIIPLSRDRWADWLDPDVPASEVLRHLPKDSLSVTRVYPPQADVGQGTLAL